MFQSGWGGVPDPDEGAYSAPHTPLLVGRVAFPSPPRAPPRPKTLHCPCMAAVKLQQKQLCESRDPTSNYTSAIAQMFTCPRYRHEMIRIMIHNTNTSVLGYYGNTESDTLINFSPPAQLIALRVTRTKLCVTHANLELKLILAQITCHSELVAVCTSVAVHHAARL